MTSPELPSREAREMLAAEFEAMGNESMATDLRGPEHRPGRLSLNEVALRAIDKALQSIPSNGGREAENLAQLFHETYERLAPSFGYEARKDSAIRNLKAPRHGG